jgi:hypothetical protein
MPVDRAQVEPVLAAAEAALATALAAGEPVVAIGNEFRSGDWLGNTLRRNAAIAGSSGACWCVRVPLAGATYFPK